MGLFSSARQVKMTRYSLDPENATKSAKAMGSHLRVHFKNTRETAQAIKRMHLRRAVKYLKTYVTRLNVSHSEGTTVESADVPRLRTSVPPRDVGPRRALNSFCSSSRTLRAMPSTRVLIPTTWSLNTSR